MSDCVDRETVLCLIKEKWNMFSNADDAIQESIDSISALPAVEPERPKGHWIKTPKTVMGEGYLWYCDKCGHQVYQDSSRPYPSERFCPNCGVKMEGENE